MNEEETKRLEARRDDNETHMRMLIANLKRLGKNYSDLMELLGVGSTVAFMIWEKYDAR